MEDNILVLKILSAGFICDADRRIVLYITNVLCHFQQYICCIVLLALLVGEIAEKHRPPQQITDKLLSHKAVSSTLQLDAGIKLTTLTIMGTDCIGRCKSLSFDSRYKRLL
jgi:hypothetical protein